MNYTKREQKYYSIIKNLKPTTSYIYLMCEHIIPNQYFRNIKSISYVKYEETNLPKWEE